MKGDVWLCSVCEKYLAQIRFMQRKYFKEIARRARGARTQTTGIRVHFDTVVCSVSFQCCSERERERELSLVYIYMRHRHESERAAERGERDPTARAHRRDSRTKELNKPLMEYNCGCRPVKRTRKRSLRSCSERRTWREARATASGWEAAARLYSVHPQRGVIG